ncbi:MAG: type II secretion system protein GspG [bacterium]
MWYTRKIEKSARGGFTLVELLLVVTILGILAAVVVVNFTGKGDDARKQATRTSISAISTAVSTFDATKSRLPESLDELCTETAEGAAMLDKANLNDSWGKPFQYKKASKFKYEIRSAGPDGNMGTEDDLTN